MGVNSREYYQDDRPPTLLGGEDVPLTRGYVALLVAIFIAQLVFQGLERYLRLEGSVLKGEVWRLVTYSVLHDRRDLLHLLFNLIGIWFVGGQIERTSSRRDYLQIIILSALCGSVAHLVFGLLVQRDIPCLGASAVFFGMFIYVAMLYPRQPVSFMGLVTLELRWLALAFAAIDIFSLIGSLQRGGLSSVSYASHVGGMIFGLLYARMGSSLTDWIDGSNWARFLRWRRQAWTSRSLRVVSDDNEEQLEAQVDVILEKISTHGSESLSAKERAILEKASARYKSRS